MWRSVRARGDTKTRLSRHTLALPQLTITALRSHQGRPDGQHQLVFATRDGNQLDAANVRREFRAAVTAARIPGTWTPANPATPASPCYPSAASPIEEIARIAGHATTRTTELVYRQELRPVITTGATAFDHLFPATAQPPSA